MKLETIIVALIVGIAAGYVALRAVRYLTGRTRCSCGKKTRQCPAARSIDSYFDEADSPAHSSESPRT